MKRLIWKIVRRFHYLLLKSLVDDRGCVCVKIGSDGCGWYVPSDFLISSARSPAVCVGAGEDVSFDLELLRRGFPVHCVDPTPRASEHVSGVISGNVLSSDSGYPYPISEVDFSKFKFWLVGLWIDSCEMKFYEPQISTHVSHSIVNLQRTNGFFIAKCLSFSDFVSEARLDRVGLVKMDIEGAEYSVLASLIASGVSPDVILVEYDEANHPSDFGFFARIRSSVIAVRQYGYKVVFVDNGNITFAKI